MSTGWHLHQSMRPMIAGCPCNRRWPCRAGSSGPSRRTDSSQAGPNCSDTGIMKTRLRTRSMGRSHLKCKPLSTDNSKVTSYRPVTSSLAAVGAEVREWHLAVQRGCGMAAAGCMSNNSRSRTVPLTPITASLASRNIPRGNRRGQHVRRKLHRRGELLSYREFLAAAPEPHTSQFCARATVRNADAVDG